MVSPTSMHDIKVGICARIRTLPIHRGHLHDTFSNFSLHRMDRWHPNGPEQELRGIRGHVLLETPGRLEQSEKQAYAGQATQRSGARGEFAGAPDQGDQGPLTRPVQSRPASLHAALQLCSRAADISTDLTFSLCQDNGKGASADPKRSKISRLHMLPRCNSK